MSASRTPEQIAADDALTEAIEKVLEAYYPDDNDGIMLEYVVLVRSRDWNDDGISITASSMLTRDNDVPVDLLLGMTEYASARLRKQIAEA
ncbi:hypothetical protein M1M07_07645 [Rhodococcus sp. HM1]|uniref:hypothetical protein n=1 Tax=Rhodococcus sp. HM1 TaxID=2937759 RepID=UPI002009F127|nr:hypothetical protein [Rhodococcus sp. HM1]MCK8670990.1 hypothetical protein [Rhodococcus sp. HM1]